MLMCFGGVTARAKGATLTGVCLNTVSNFAHCGSRFFAHIACGGSMYFQAWSMRRLPFVQPFLSVMPCSGLLGVQLPTIIMSVIQVSCTDTTQGR